MAANGTWSATVLAHRPQQCLLLSRRGPDTQRWRRAAAAGRPRRRPWRLHSRRHTSPVCLALLAPARCSSISCYNYPPTKSPSSRCFAVIESWKRSWGTGAASGHTPIFERGAVGPPESRLHLQAFIRNRAARLKIPGLNRGASSTFAQAYSQS